MRPHSLLLTALPVLSWALPTAIDRSGELYAGVLIDCTTYGGVDGTAALTTCQPHKSTQAVSSVAEKRDISMAAWKETMDDTSAVKRQAYSGVYYCSDVFWTGNCVWRQEELGGGNCVSLPDNVSSFGPDPGFTCTVFGNGLCRDFGEGSHKFVYPGEPNLVNVGWNDKARSYFCVKS